MINCNLNPTENQVLALLSDAPVKRFTRKQLQDELGIQSKITVNQALCALVEGKHVVREEGIPPLYRLFARGGNDANTKREEFVTVFLDLSSVQDAVPRLTPYLGKHVRVYAFATSEDFCEGARKDGSGMPDSDYYTLWRSTTKSRKFLYAQLSWTLSRVTLADSSVSDRDRDRDRTYLLVSKLDDMEHVAKLASGSTKSPVLLKTSTHDLMMYVE
jgi:hypothetical protein